MKNVYGMFTVGDGDDFEKKNRHEACLQEKFEEKKIFERSIQVQYEADTNLAMEQKEELRAKFLALLTDVRRSGQTCASDNAESSNFITSV
jgi:hypothetical protein